MDTLEEVKAKRPPCVSEDGKHTWISNHSTKEQYCHDCGYREKYIYEIDV